MKKIFSLLPAVFVFGLATAQTPATNAPPAVPKPHVVDVPQPDQPPVAATSPDNIDPVKVAEFQKRFHDGLALEKEGKLKEARDIYDGILTEQPNARGSLLQAGQVSLELGELERADGYLERLRKVVPDEELEKLHEVTPNFPDVLDELIQISQELKRDVKVELLIKEFVKLRESGRLPKLSESLWFQRELIHTDQQDIAISQAFDYLQDPNTVWMAEVTDPQGHLLRRILLNYEPDGTRELRAKDAKYANTQVFSWRGHIVKNGQVSEIDTYLQIFALPDYQKFRSAMLLILANPPKPIDSATLPPQQ
jgi:tetratricopeptide (TPR) repeat protein